MLGEALRVLGYDHVLQVLAHHLHALEKGAFFHHGGELGGVSSNSVAPAALSEFVAAVRGVELFLGLCGASQKIVGSQELAREVVGVVAGAVGHPLRGVRLGDDRPVVDVAFGFGPLVPFHAAAFLQAALEFVRAVGKTPRRRLGLLGCISIAAVAAEALTFLVRRREVHGIVGGGGLFFALSKNLLRMKRQRVGSVGVVFVFVAREAVIRR